MQPTTNQRVVRFWRLSLNERHTRGDEMVMWWPARTQIWTIVYCELAREKILKVIFQCESKSAKLRTRNGPPRHTWRTKHLVTHTRRNPFCTRKKLQICCDRWVCLSAVWSRCAPRYAVLCCQKALCAGNFVAVRQEESTPHQEFYFQTPAYERKPCFDWYAFQKHD